MRVLCIILDSVGCGYAPDAKDYGDEGANTLGNLFANIPDFELPNMARLGLYHILSEKDEQGIPPKPPLHMEAAYTRLTERSAGKDTTTGHWELMGAVVKKPFATFTQFPQELVGELERLAGTEFLGNVSASGTEIIEALGEEHMRTGKPILYTSADSVLQIAAHENTSIFGLDRLLQLCRDVRRLLNKKDIRIGRVIARPFRGESSTDFQRTSNRHDYSLNPPQTILNVLQQRGIPTIGIGKIGDIYDQSGISESHPTTSNEHGMKTIEMLWEVRQTGLMLVNLVDFDMLYGHRRNPEGYAECLRKFDAWLGDFLPMLREEDTLLITADHGNDPYYSGTDHTREQVPLLTCQAPDIIPNSGYTEVARLIKEKLLVR